MSIGCCTTGGRPARGPLAGLGPKPAPESDHIPTQGFGQNPWVGPGKLHANVGESLVGFQGHQSEKQGRQARSGRHSWALGWLGWPGWPGLGWLGWLGPGCHWLGGLAPAGWPGGLAAWAGWLGCLGWLAGWPLGAGLSCPASQTQPSQLRRAPLHDSHPCDTVLTPMGRGTTESAKTGLQQSIAIHSTVTSEFS